MASPALTRCHVIPTKAPEAPLDALNQNDLHGLRTPISPCSCPVCLPCQPAHIPSHLSRPHFPRNITHPSSLTENSQTNRTNAPESHFHSQLPISTSPLSTALFMCPLTFFRATFPYANLGVDGGITPSGTFSNYKPEWKKEKIKSC